MIDFIPKPIAGVETEIIEGEVLLYHPRQTRAIYLNSTAALIWGLCDGNRSAGEIIQMVGESYSDAAATLEDDVLMTLKELQRNGVLSIG
jgi:pyrroloquinoline quinone biosynthesis protein D